MARQARWRTATAMLLGVLIVTVVPWWLRQDNQHLFISGRQAALMLLVMALTYWMLTRASTPEQDTTTHKRLRVLIYAAFCLGVGYLVLSTGLSLTTANTTVWHHWGAYIGPAQLIAAGALPLHDIPLQYGLGPSLILAQGCKSDCWTSLYWISGVATIVLTCLIAGMALQFNRSRHPLSVAATLAIILTSCLLWTAYPPALMASMATPSTTGMRFLPGVLMLTWAIRQSRRNDPLESSAKWGHLLWMVCSLWSPEAAIHATAVWAPYFVWTRTFRDGSAGGGRRFARAIAILGLVLLAGLTVFTLGYRITLGEWPLPVEYVAYLLHPPGPLPINPRGTIWFAVACMACWIAGLSFTRREASDGQDERASWLVALLCLATFTYYLGRSHDNNILNLLPFLGLLLLAARAVTPPGAVHTLATSLLAALLGWATTFGWMGFPEAQAQGRLLTFAPQELSESFNRETNRSLFYMLPQAREMQLHPEDAVPALKYIRDTFHEPVEVFDSFLLVDRGEIYPPWNALHGPENFVFFPSEIRRIYLARIAKRLQKPGWVLYERTSHFAQYLIEYDSVYHRTRELDFGSYKAIRYAPR